MKNKRTSENENYEWILALLLASFCFFAAILIAGIFHSSGQNPMILIAMVLPFGGFIFGGRLIVKRLAINT